MLSLVSPAKINLFLRILARRPDGYHELASLFQAIDLFDTLHYSLADEDRLTCSLDSLPTDRSNLVWKAVELFRRRTGLSARVQIHLEKRIPLQSGLGGGSSNAATTLWALNELLGHPATLAQLIEWSGEIGSDITFFLSQGTAYCTGRGEIVKFLPALPKKSLWIAKPEEGLSTPEVYRNVDVTKLTQRDPEESLKAFLNDETPFYNDLEPAAFAVKPSLQSFKSELLNSGYSHVLMSGSGTSFACFGPGVPPCLPGAELFSAHFINRVDDEWYSAPVHTPALARI